MTSTTLEALRAARDFVTRMDAPSRSEQAFTADMLAAAIAAEEARLPLGHAFVRSRLEDPDVCAFTVRVTASGVPISCGQPKAAHEAAKKQGSDAGLRERLRALVERGRYFIASAEHQLTKETVTTYGIFKVRGMSEAYREWCDWLAALLEQAPSAPAPAAPAQRTYWLIERGQAVNHTPVIWWKGGDARPLDDSSCWTERAHEARRFATHGEAEALCARLFGYLWNVPGREMASVTEHVFLKAPAPDVVLVGPGASMTREDGKIVVRCAAPTEREAALVAAARGDRSRCYYCCGCEASMCMHSRAHCGLCVALAAYEERT